MKIFKITIPQYIFIVSLVIFWFTANPLPSGYADSDELITTGYLLSVAHPPGYGLNILLISLFQHLLFFLPPAYASNLLAGLLHALTLTLLYKTVVLLLPTKTKRSSPWLLAVGVLAAGLNSLFWLYSSVIEVVSLSDFFVSLILYLSVSWATSPHPQTRKSILTIAAILGIGSGHYQPLILLAPALLILYLLPSRLSSWHYKISQILLAIMVTLVGFFLSSAVIFPLNNRYSDFSWTFPSNPAGLWHMITRQDYSGTFFDRNIVIENAYVNQINWGFISRLPSYLAALWNHFAGLPSLFIFVGFYYLYKKSSRPIFIFLCVSYLLAGALFGSYVTVSDYDSTDLQYRLLSGTADRQYLLGYTLLIPIFALGLMQVFTTRIRAWLSLVVLVSIFAANFSMGDQRHNSVVYDYVSTMLDNAEPNSVIICSSDFACFGLYYQSIVEHKRPDVTILTSNTRARQNFLVDHPEYYDYLYPENPNFTGQLLAHNVPRRPTYMTSLSQFNIDYFGFDGNPFFVVPKNYLIKITLSKPTEMDTPVRDPLLLKISSYNIDHRDLHLLGFKDYLASYYQVMARSQTKFNYPLEASASLDYALYLNPNDPRVIDWRLKLNQFIFSFTYDNIGTSSAQYLDLAKNYEATNQLELAEASARKAHYLIPQDPKPLEFLHRLYTTYNYPQFANWTAQHLRALGYL